MEDLRTKYFAIEISLPLAVEPKGNCPQLVSLDTITYKSRLTQKKLYKKTDAIFSIYGRNGINP
jgi:hypothetical protein